MTDWQAYFESNRANLIPVDWSDRYRLTPDEVRTILSSVQQFQLGESSEGRRMLAQAAQYAETSGDHAYLPALRLFVQEEQRHAAELARFLQQQSLPCKEKHWVDDVFRGLRRLTTLEMSVVVLLTAEVIAVTYYKALQDATQSPTLRTICTQILRDEIKHLEFQSETLAKIRRGRGALAQAITRLLQRVLFTGTLVIVWHEHGTVYRAGGFRLRKFWARNWQRFIHTFER